MKKKPPVLRLAEPKAVFQSDERSWHNGGDIEIGLYARSLHNAAKTLIATLNLEPNSKTAWDACPVVLMYRQSVELHLKALVGEGSNFLPSRTDPITLYKTHSLRWLAQIVCQIIKAVRWENEFKCEGIATLADFSAVVNELEALDPVSIAVQSVGRARWLGAASATATERRSIRKTGGLPPNFARCDRRCAGGGMGHTRKGRRVR